MPRTEDGTFSTGISINNIHNVIFTESFKSDVIIKQSIGRGLRLHKRKDVLTIIDFVDDMRFVISGGKDEGKTWKNYLYKHSEARKIIYKEEQFPYTIVPVKF